MLVKQMFMALIIHVFDRELSLLAYSILVTSCGKMMHLIVHPVVLGIPSLITVAGNH